MEAALQRLEAGRTEAILLLAESAPAARALDRNAVLNMDMAMTIGMGLTVRCRSQSDGGWMREGRWRLIAGGGWGLLARGAWRGLQPEDVRGTVQGLAQPSGVLAV